MLPQTVVLSNSEVATVALLPFAQEPVALLDSDGYTRTTANSLAKAIEYAEAEIAYEIEMDAEYN